MSRIGNKPINVPAGVEVKIDGKHISVKGPKGTLERTIEPEISLNLDGTVLTVSRDSDERRSKSLHGPTNSLSIPFTIIVFTWTNKNINK